MSRRAFELLVRVRDSDDKKWVAIDQPICIEASSFDELCAALHSALLGLGRVEPSSVSVSIESVFDGDEGRTTALRAELAPLKIKALLH